MAKLQIDIQCSKLGPKRYEARLGEVFAVAKTAKEARDELREVLVWRASHPTPGLAWKGFPMETILTPRMVLFGSWKMREGWRVKKATARAVTIWRPNLSGSARFEGKRYQYRWDGTTGYKRGGEYLKVLAPAAE